LQDSFEDLRATIKVVRTEIISTKGTLMRVALSALKENPTRKTGLTLWFHELVEHSVLQFPDLEWIVFVGPNQEWKVRDERVTVVRDFPAGDRLTARLLADHFLISPKARELGASVLVTVDFVPVRKTLPTVMHVLSMQHVARENGTTPLRRLYRSWATTRGFRTADAIIANSEFTRAQVLEEFPQCADKLAVSYEGVEHEQFFPEGHPGEAERIRGQFQIEPGYLLWVSNFYPYKQAELLLEGYALLDAATRKQFPLVMAGGQWRGGGDSARCKARALGISGDVHFLGWVDDEWVAPLYRNARVFVLASREETFGSCVAEAMACGTPCLLNDIPIMRELTAGHAAFVDFHEREAVARELRRLLTDEAYRAQLRAYGLARAANFSWDKYSRDGVEVIRGVASRN
jgi:glycosyltransferase involved in cell wall biosynthesis